VSERPLVQIEGVSKSFRGSGGYDLRRRRRVRQVIKALDDVSLSIRRHETVALVGESGSGKSTLARIVMRLLEPDAGRVLLDGEDMLAMDRQTLTSARRRIQMVFQDPYSSLNPRRTAGAAIAEPARVHGIVGRDGEERFVTELLERVGLSGRMAKRLPRELSGGQRQRLAIARALAVEPEILVADEAVSALDVTIQAQILNLFESLRSELGFTMLFISHQLPVVAHVSDRVAVMYQGGSSRSRRRPSSSPTRPIHTRPACSKPSRAASGAASGRRGGATRRFPPSSCWSAAAATETAAPSRSPSATRPGRRWRRRQRVARRPATGPARSPSHRPYCNLINQ
jgi:oligopeptide transport system ATP-binding protein